MLTDKEMKQIAERFINKLGKESNIELLLNTNFIKKTYGNIYLFNSKEYVLTGATNMALGGNAPFLVEKETGKVVTFGTASKLEYYIKDYENDSLGLCLTRYWYPDEDRYDYK